MPFIQIRSANVFISIFSRSWKKILHFEQIFSIRYWKSNFHYIIATGFWLFHCHLSFHIEVGMGLIFQIGEPEDLPPVPKNFPTCGNWFGDEDNDDDNELQHSVTTSTSKPPGTTLLFLSELISMHQPYLKFSLKRREGGKGWEAGTGRHEWVRVMRHE